MESYRIGLLGLVLCSLSASLWISASMEFNFLSFPFANFSCSS